MRFGFGQSAFTIIATVSPGQQDALRATLDSIGRDPSSNAVLPFGQMASLHFCSLVIIPANPWDSQSLLMFEGNIDGPVDAFLRQLVAQAGSGVDAIFRHCVDYPKNPSDRPGYLLKRDRGFNTFYVGCPGRTLAQIRREEAVRQQVQNLLDTWPSASPAPNAAAIRQKLKSAATPVTRPFLVRHGLAVLVIVALLLVALVVGSIYLVSGSLAITVVTVLGILLAVGAAVGLGAVYLRHLEKTDPVDENRFYAPSVDAAVKREDVGFTNHFAAVTFIKPGWFRRMLLRGVLAAIHAAGLFIANKGQLSGIPSIHFARWLIVDEHRLLFLSNYGGSWENYLNDFIDKAHGGLTAVWSNTGGFPRSRYLFGEGATQERAFKVYARNSQLASRVWYHAYPELTTINIENNTRISEGLLNPTSEDEQRWLARL